MAKKRIPSSDESILADWDTGEYSREYGGSKSQRDLAYKHNVSVGKISKLVKGRVPAMYKVVNDLVTSKQILAEQNEQTVSSVNSVVDERTKHIAFFNSAAIKNVEEAMDKGCSDQVDYKYRAETIQKGREVVLGKTPDTAIQINNEIKFDPAKLRSLSSDEATTLQALMEKAGV